MSRDRKQLPPPTGHLPAASPTMPSVVLPSLPSSSGKVWGSRTTIMRADADFVRASADLLEARTTQTNQMKALVDARIGLALKIAELAILPELARHEYERGRRDRAHEVTIQQLTHATAEMNARINLLRAQQHLQSLEPQPEVPPPSPSSLPIGLTPTDVQKVAQIMPDMKPETIEALVLALSGFLAEKTK